MCLGREGRVDTVRVADRIRSRPWMPQGGGVRFALPLPSRPANCKTKPSSQHITLPAMPKKNRKTADSQSSQCRVCKSHTTRGETLMSLQHSPYLTPSASGGPRVLTRPQRRRQQETEGPSRPSDSFVANSATSVGQEGSFAVFDEV